MMKSELISNENTFDQTVSSTITPIFSYSKKLPSANLRKNAKNFRISLHSTNNLLGLSQKNSLFSEHIQTDWVSQYGHSISEKINRYGSELTDNQLNLVETILKKFSETDYKGNIEPKSIDEFTQEVYGSIEVPPAYKTIKKIPRLKIQQNELLRAAGIDLLERGDKQRALEDLKTLATTQFCFFYHRLVKNEHGEGLKKATGEWLKEEVTTIEPLFRIKEVRDPDTKQFLYYEIEPASIFIDQVDSYFLLIPNDWREEVKKTIGKASSYVYRFLLFLRYEYALRERTRSPKPYVIKWDWVEIAQAINMPESVWKRNKKRAQQILNNCYETAKKLDYLSEYKSTKGTEILLLNDKKYVLYANAALENNVLESNSDIPLLGNSPSDSKEITLSNNASDIFALFYTEKRRIDDLVTAPDGHEKNKQLQIIDTLLKTRSVDDVKQVIKWGLSRKFWVTQIGTLEKLTKNFDKAFSEMKLDTKYSTISSIEENKRYAETIVNKWQALPVKERRQMLITMGSGYIEFCKGGQSIPEIIKFESQDFKNKCKNIIATWGLMLKITIE